MGSDSLNDVLRTAKTYLRNLEKFRHVLVVLGNETCDLDSAVASLVYGLLLHHQRAADTITVPVFNIPRVQLPLKTEVTYVLNKHNIPLDNIVCRDEIDLALLHAEGRLRLTLVDHHVLQPADSGLAGSVVAVVDHRPQDPAWPWPGVDVTLRTVGSCCSLVADKLLTQAPSLITPTAAELLLGAILVDTACLSEAAGRATQLDHQMTEQLGTVLQGVDLCQLCTELQTAKQDVSSLSAAQLLIKDLKVAAGIPIAGLPIKVNKFLERGDAESSTEKFCKERSADVCVLYGSAVGTRDLAVYSSDNPGAAAQVIEALKQSTEPSLDLKQQACSVPGFTLFEQTNVKPTRKQFLPIIRQIGEKLYVKG